MGDIAVAAAPPAAVPLVRGVVSDAVTVPLQRDLPGALRHSFDEGVVNASAIYPHIRLALTRPAAAQAALDKLTHDQHTRGTADYHRWLTPAQLRSYGPAQSDITQVVTWLIRHGLTVNRVSPSGMSIDFGGTAGRVQAAFHTTLHNVAFAGKAHIANVTAPAIPAALAPVVTGVTLSNFFPKPALQHITHSFTAPTAYGTFYAVAPPDFATIYNINPLRTSHNAYGQPITGKGVTLAVVEQTLIKAADWKQFRSIFGLSSYKGTLSQIQPSGCASPGTTGDEVEATIDAEWSSAVAPDATIVSAACEGTPPFEFGVMTSLINLVEYGTPATIFSVSYGGDETEDGYAFQAVWNNAVEEGAAEGKAIFVSAGDSGVSRDEGAIDGTGLFVNGLADTAYNVSVGGTDFQDFALGESAKYWSATNSATGGSVKSYLPEIPWNNSCASSVIAQFAGARTMPLCNSTYANIQNGIGGSGSQSVYYTKPDWQLTSVLGMPNDGVRDQPDVSLFAANGIWNHFYLICFTDQKEGGAPGCDYSNTNDLLDNAYGGTSFGAPDFAGIEALVQQTYDIAYQQIVPLGNPAPTMYLIAQAQFTTPLGLSTCNSHLGNAVGPACAFYYVTVGSNAQPCYAGTPSCYTDSQSTAGIGILLTKVAGTPTFAYPAQTGYSLATGLGTVNVTNFLYNYVLLN